MCSSAVSPSGSKTRWAAGSRGRVHRFPEGRKRKASTRPGRGRWRAPDKVKRKFGAEGINSRWHGGGTEIVTGEGNLYLDSVLDMGSRRIVGFALGEHHDAALAYGALAMAVAVRGGCGQPAALLTVLTCTNRADLASSPTTRSTRSTAMPGSPN